MCADTDGLSRFRRSEYESVSAPRLDISIRAILCASLNLTIKSGIRYRLLSPSVCLYSWLVVCVVGTFTWRMVENPLNYALCTPMRIGIAWMRDGGTQWVPLSATIEKTSDAESARGTQRIV